MADTRAKKRIRNKNKKKARKSKEEIKTPECGLCLDTAIVEDPQHGQAMNCPECQSKPAPTGPEPVGLKERVKQGFLSTRDALGILAEDPNRASPALVKWLRRRS